MPVNFLVAMTFPGKPSSNGKMDDKTFAPGPEQVEQPSTGMWAQQLHFAMRAAMLLRATAQRP